MIDKHYIRALAEAERLMDEGKIPYVQVRNLQGQLERLSVNPKIMEEFGLVTGQNVNSIVVNAIFRRSLELVSEDLERSAQELEDSLLDPDFDYRSIQDEDDC